MVMKVCLDSIEEFRQSLLDRALSHNTVRAYVADVRLLFSEQIQAPEIPTDQLETAALRWLSSNRMKWEPRTLMRKVTSLKMFMEWLGMDKPLDKFKNPTVDQPDPHPLPRLLEDLEAMIRLAREPDQVILIVLCGLIGMRISEALAAESQHFNLTAKTVRIRGKGDVTRVVPVSARAMSLLLDRITERFLAGGGKLLTYNDRSARKTITTLGDRAGVSRPVASHDLRATFATMAYERTKDIVAVSRLLGHRNIQTTMTYVGVNKDRLRNAASFAEVSYE
jgi:site-specific recombinase XerD